MHKSGKKHSSGNLLCPYLPLQCILCVQLPLFLRLMPPNNALSAHYRKCFYGKMYCIFFTVFILKHFTTTCIFIFSISLFQFLTLPYLLKRTYSKKVFFFSHKQYNVKNLYKSMPVCHCKKKREKKFLYVLLFEGLYF